MRDDENEWTFAVVVDWPLAIRPARIDCAIACLVTGLRREDISSDEKINCGGPNLSKLVVDGKSERIAKKTT